MLADIDSSTVELMHLAPRDQLSLRQLIVRAEQRQFARGASTTFHLSWFFKTTVMSGKGREQSDVDAIGYVRPISSRDLGLPNRVRDFAVVFAETSWRSSFRKCCTTISSRQLFK